MQPFHLVRISQARPFLDVLEQLGASVEQLALEAGLAVSALREEDTGVIGEYALWQFIEAGALAADCPLLGHQCARAYPVDADARLGDLPLRRGSTLEKTLEFFNEDVMQLSTASYYSLDHRSGGCWFRRAQAYGREHASWQAELYSVSILLQVMRLHTSEDWLPNSMRFSAADKAQPLPKRWAETQVEWGADATGIQLADDVLSLPPRIHSARKKSPAPQLRRPAFSDLVETQVRSRSVGIDKAALQLGLSRSTLQRYLKASGTSYQDVLEQVRKAVACDLLKNSATPVGEVAGLLGYAHVGNFTRAFTRWTGRPPRAYRD